MLLKAATPPLIPFSPYRLPKTVPALPFSYTSSLFGHSLSSFFLPVIFFLFLSSFLTSFLTLLNIFLSFFLPFSLSFSLFPQRAPGPSEFQQVPQTVHCLGNAACCLPSPPPPPPPVWQETRLGGVWLLGPQGHWV